MICRECLGAHSVSSRTVTQAAGHSYRRKYLRRCALRNRRPSPPTLRRTGNQTERGADQLPAAERAEDARNRYRPRAGTCADRQCSPAWSRHRPCPRAAGFPGQRARRDRGQRDAGRRSMRGPEGAPARHFIRGWDARVGSPALPKNVARSRTGPGLLLGICMPQICSQSTPPQLTVPSL